MRGTKWPETHLVVGVLRSYPGSRSHAFSPSRLCCFISVHAASYDLAVFKSFFLDFVMPFFLFAVGLSMSFSFKRALSKNDPAARTVLVKKISLRSIKLFVLGLLTQVRWK